MEVEYDPRVISYEQLVKAAVERGCASRVYTRNDTQQAEAAKVAGERRATRADDPVVPDKDQKYYLGRTEYRFLPMTPTQAARANAAIGAQKSPGEFLSPAQLWLFGAVKRFPKAKWPVAFQAGDFVAAWEKSRDMAVKLGARENWNVPSPAPNADADGKSPDDVETEADF